MKRKPKPATAGEKIADGYACGIWHTRLSRRIDRAIARAVKKERDRCMGFVDQYHLGKIPHVFGLYESIRRGAQLIGQQGGTT